MVIKNRIPIALMMGVALWGATLALYLSTLAPTLTWGNENVGVDGGELLAAANTLGIPHPPGYPTYTLLLKLFATVVPVGDFAYRGNLLSAMLASGSVVLLYLVILRLCRFLRPDGPDLFWIGSAVLGAAAFATSPLFWSQAIMTEVYTLNTLFIGALLLIAAQVVLRAPSDNERTDRSINVRMVLFGLLLGLGLGNHLTLLAVAVPLLVWLWVALGWRRVVSTWTIVSLMVGLGIYAYLPIRAAQVPPINWGDPDSLGGFVCMLSGRAYQGYVFGVPVGDIPGRLFAWVEVLFSQFNPLGLFLGLVGTVRLRSTAPAFLVMSLVSAAILILYGITYFTFDFEVITIPVFMIFSVWIGTGFLWILSSASAWARQAMNGRRHLKLERISLTSPRPVLLLSVAALGILPISSAVLNYNSQDLSDDQRAYQYIRDVKGSVPDGSVVLSNEEITAFSLWYIRYVEDSEWDVVPIVVPLLQFDSGTGAISNHGFATGCRRKCPQTSTRS